MKTKEINVWVNRDFLDLTDEDKYIKQIFLNRKHPLFELKAKIIIEIPKKKIEITEDDLRKAFERHANSYGVLDNYKSSFSVIAKELGF